MAQLNIRLDKKLHKAYKKFCRQNCLVMARRVEELIKMDLEHQSQTLFGEAQRTAVRLRRLIKLPGVKP